MSTENNLAPYSPTTVYGQLTSPFTPKTVTINAHTPFDKVDETKSKVFSREDFTGKPLTKIIYSELANNYLLEVEKEDDNILNNYDVSSFSISEFSNDNILKGVLTAGYSPKEAETIKMANEAYKKSVVITNKAPEVLSKCSYKVF